MGAQHIIRRRKLALSAATSLIAVSLSGSGAYAQSAASDSAADEAKSSETEIIVQGQFQQSLIDRIPITPEELPFTLNVVDRAYLEERNFARPIEALTTLPNITRTEDRLGTGTAGFLSRGFDAPILVDNRVQNNFRGSGARDDSFVERYEVLKGPASIALGPIGAGGVINSVSKVPKSDMFYTAKLRVDHFGSVGAELDANFGDISGNDSILFRVSGAYRDFQFDAAETKRETFAIRPVVVSNLGDATSFRASVALTSTDLNPNSGFPLLSNGEIPSQIDTDTFTGFDNGEGEIEDLYYEGEISHEFLDNLKLTVRGSHHSTDFDYQNHSGLYNYNYADGVPGIGLNDPYVYSYTGGGQTESRTTFVDAQLAYQADIGGLKQDFVVGIAYEEDSFDRLFSAFPIVGPIGLDQLDIPRLGPDNIGPVSPFTLNDQKLHSVFAEAAIRPTDWLILLAGVRYDDLEQLTVNFRRGNRFESPFDDDQVTFRAGATATVTDGLNVYASFAQAFSPQFGLRRDNSPVPPELSDGYEVGVKGSLFGGAASFETGYFYTLRKNVSVIDPANVVGEAFRITIGELSVQGVEFSGRFSPAPGFNLDLNVGYNDIDILVAGNNEVTAAIFPDLNGSAYASYQIQSGTLKGLKFGGGFRHVGKREGRIVDFDSYTIADANISYPVNEQITFSVDVLNVTDELYLENAASFAQNLTGGSVLGPPRTAVFTVRGRF